MLGFQSNCLNDSDSCKEIIFLFVPTQTGHRCTAAVRVVTEYKLHGNVYEKQKCDLKNKKNQI